MPLSVGDDVSDAVRAAQQQASDTTMSRDPPQVSETMAALLLRPSDSLCERSDESGTGDIEVPMAGVASKMREDTYACIADCELESLATTCSARVGLGRDEGAKGAHPVADRVVDQLADGLEDECLQSGLVVVLDHQSDPHGDVVSVVLLGDVDYLQKSIGPVFPLPDREITIDHGSLRKVVEHIHPLKI